MIDRPDLRLYHNFTVTITRGNKKCLKAKLK